MTSDKWVDMYEPKSLDEMVGQTELVNAFKLYVKTNHIPNITISGNPGCGKTLLTKCFAADMGWVKFENGRQIDIIPGQFYIFNASEDRGIDTVRTTMKRIASRPTFDGTPRLIVLDEFNYTPEAQGAMRALMENYSSNARFIILSNDVNNIIDPIISRCPMKVANPLSINDINVIVERIKKEKQFQVSSEAIELLFKLTSGDIRKFIGMLQDACIVSNYNIQINHIQSVDIDIQIAKSILEASIINYEQAKDVLITVFSKTKNSKLLLERLYEATHTVRFSDDINTNRLIAMRLREKIANIDFQITQGTNQLLQLSSIINYVQILKFIPITCPKAK